MGAWWRRHVTCLPQKQLVPWLNTLPLPLTQLPQQMILPTFPSLFFADFSIFFPSFLLVREAKYLNEGPHCHSIWMNFNIFVEPAIWMQEVAHFLRHPAKCTHGRWWLAVRPARTSHSWEGDGPRDVKNCAKKLLRQKQFISFVHGRPSTSLQFKSHSMFQSYVTQANVSNVTTLISCVPGARCHYMCCTHRQGFERLILICQFRAQGHGNINGFFW